MDIKQKTWKKKVGGVDFASKFGKMLVDSLLIVGVFLMRNVFLMSLLFMNF